MKKVVSLQAFKQAHAFSCAEEITAKIASQSDHAKMQKPPVNLGSSAVVAITIPGHLGGTSQAPKTNAKKKAAVAAKAHPVAAPTSGPNGYKIDCQHMTATQLRLAYPGEYTSWKDGKSRCKKKDWPWSPAWSAFVDFLLSMGPKPTPQHTLDRIDNSLGAYGPGLCRWASKVEQNNNKSDNIKIVLPLVGAEFSAKKLAHLNKVAVKTIYKWKANGYSDLEMIAGKKSQHLAALTDALAKLPLAKPSKSLPPKMRFPEYKPPSFSADDWDPDEAELDLYHETGIMRFDSQRKRHRSEYDAIIAWVNGYNAGLPVSVKPPQGRYFKPKLPGNAPLPTIAPSQSASSKLPMSSYDDVPDAENDTNFDPADCADPEADPDYDPTDCIDPGE